MGRLIKLISVKKVQPGETFLTGETERTYEVYEGEYTASSGEVMPFLMLSDTGSRVGEFPCMEGSYGIMEFIKWYLRCEVTEEVEANNDPDR